MLTKQAIDISFAQGLDTKTDPKRVQVGKFLEFENAVFQKGGLLQKRNGYAPLASLPDTTYSYLTTFSGNLTAVGQKIAALNAASSTWVPKGSIEPLSVATLPLIRNNLNQIACDSAVASNGLVCTAYLETDGTTITNKYVIADSVTGQNIVAPVAIPVSSGTVSGGMRVFVLGTHFIILFTNTISGTAHLQYIAVNIANPTIVTANADIASSYVPSSTLSWDGVVVGSNLYIAYDTTSGGQAVAVTYLSTSFGLPSPTRFSGRTATMMSVTSDLTNPGSPIIFVSFYDSGSSTGYTAAVNQSLNVVFAPVETITTGSVLNLTSLGADGVCQIFYETSGHVIDTLLVSGAGAGSPTAVLRGVGLASKAFFTGSIADGTARGYFLAAFSTTYQPTYFLIDYTSTAASPKIAAKIAYQNGGGYLTTGLPGVSVFGMTAQVPYLFKDLIEAVNKGTNVPSGTQTAGIYSQTGINLATFEIGTQTLDTAEIGNDLHLTGGFLWMYDGYLPVEHNFFVWPEPVTAVGSGSGGNLAAATYYYQVTYEWTDNQGNAFRSAPSIPVSVTTTGSTSSVALTIPTLRVTMKTANPVKIVVYRWSTNQQNYYQTTSISAPLLNSTTTDSVNFTDTNADATILGNNLIYTTGGVVEDINAPASNIMAIFDTRLWLIDAEDPNVAYYSKQAIEATPIEMSDLFTVYISPTTGTQNPTGPVKTLAVMDDKLIFGKKDAFLYINGTGPDNTGANSQYSQPTFITTTVGCENQKSLVLTPQGLMFQSNKGIWLLDRGLGTDYIGAPVEDFTTGAQVTSAVLVPETNQVRFTLDSGITLMYDYYYGQWGTFTGVPAVSSCIYDEFHTFINSSGAVFGEDPGTYLDGSSPVLMRFKTGPLRLGDLQGYQRAYFFYILGEYLSPHKLNVLMNFDYEASPSQSVLITPNNFNQSFGYGPSPFGQETPFGGNPSQEAWRVFLDRQRCRAFAVTVQEVFDASLGQPAGAGLTISGLNVVCAFKKGYTPMSAATSVG